MYVMYCGSFCRWVDACSTEIHCLTSEIVKIYNFLGYDIAQSIAWQMLMTLLKLVLLMPFESSIIPMQFPWRLSGVEQRFGDTVVVADLVVFGIPSLQHIKGFLPIFRSPQLFLFATKILTAFCVGLARYRLIKVVHEGSSTQTPDELSCAVQLSPAQK